MEKWKYDFVAQRGKFIYVLSNLLSQTSVVESKTYFPLFLNSSWHVIY